jgi:type I restriction enzyme S subunit
MSQIGAEAINESVVRRWKCYPAYKNSGVEWLGEIPEHWDVKRLKYVARLCYGDSLSSDIRTDGDIPVYGSNGKVGTHTTANTLAPCIIVGRKGSYGKVTYCNIPTFAIDTTYLIDARTTKADLKWLFYALSLLGLDTSSQDTGVPGLSRDFAYNQWLPLPELSQQIAIASFLDRETAKIDTLIAKKEQLIQLLQEKRTALISHAVTKGLNPDVPIKDSGVKWLGEIPAHWSIKRVKYCLRLIEQGWSPSCENRIAEDDEWGVLKVGCVNGTEFNPEENKALPGDLEPRSELEIKPGDVLISRANTRELLGSASVVKTVRPRLLLCDKLYRLQVSISIVNLDYLVLSLSSAIARFQMERDATGASNSMQNIGQDSVLNLVLPLPNLVEQKAIASFLDRETTKLDALIAKIRTGIEQLKEYRSALISSAVTGKIDVREIANAS